jgi:hypothetical protein
MRDYKPLIDAGMPQGYNNWFVVLILAGIVFSALSTVFSATSDAPRASIPFWTFATLSIACPLAAMGIAIRAKRRSAERAQQMTQDRT